MPRHPSIYGNLLKERIAKGGVKCWLVNTGWSGGKATQEGIKRMPIKATRALLNAALDGSLNDAEFREDPYFGFEVPVAVAGRRDQAADPRAPGPMPRIRQDRTGTGAQVHRQLRAVCRSRRRKRPSGSAGHCLIAPSIQPKGLMERNMRRPHKGRRISFKPLRTADFSILPQWSEVSLPPFPAKYVVT
jgi:hypothetical protein